MADRLSSRVPRVSRTSVLGPHRSVESRAPRDSADAIVHSLVRPFFFSVEGESRRRRLLHARCPAPSAARHHPSITRSRSSAVSSSTSPTSLRRRSITGEGTRSNAAAMDAAELKLVHGRRTSRPSLLSPPRVLWLPRVVATARVTGLRPMPLPTRPQHARRRLKPSPCVRSAAIVRKSRKSFANLS